MVKTPVFFTSVVAMVAKLARTLTHCAFLSSFAVASASAMPLLVMAVTLTGALAAALVAFIAGAIEEINKK